MLQRGEPPQRSRLPGASRFYPLELYFLVERLIFSCQGTWSLLDILAVLRVFAAPLYILAHCLIKTVLEEQGFKPIFPIIIYLYEL